jgi:ketosteroid isomerase-like protein
MSRDFVTAMFRAVDARDWAALALHFHEDLRYDRPGFPPLMGRDRVLHFYREVRAIHGTHQIEAIVIDGEAGASWGRFVGTKTDGAPVDVQYADCYRFRDGLLWRRKSFFFVPQV